MAARRADGKARMGRVLLVAALAAGLAFTDLILFQLWADPAFAAGGAGNGNGGGGGGNGGGGNGGGGGGGNGGGHGNAGGNAGGNGKGNAGGRGSGRGASGAPTEMDDPNSALGLREAGTIQPLANAYDAAERQFGGKVIDAALVQDAAQAWSYELRVVTEDGRVRTVSYDAATLALMSVDGEPAE